MEDAASAPLVIVKGAAGTAKTFYSLAVGLEKLLNNPTVNTDGSSSAVPTHSLIPISDFCREMSRRKSLR